MQTENRFLLGVSSGRIYYNWLNGTYVLDVCTFSILVPLDDQNQKMVVSVQDIRLSAHKDMHPSDSEDNVDIGLSSEEEAEDLPDDVHIRRKFVPPPVPPQSQPAPSTSTGGSANIQVPVEALQKVQQYIGQLLGGEATPGVFLPPEDPPAPTSEEVPFAVPKPKRGEKVCQLCQRKFWATETLRRHMQLHSGKQKHVCPNEGCGRKLSSKRSLETHLTTCQKEKEFFCKTKGCDKLFATKQALSAHEKTHKKLGKGMGVCKGCGKEGFTKQKSLDDHYRTCAGNPDRVGPFRCRVAGCRRGPAKPFTRIRNLNIHLKAEHGFDPKHQ